MSVIEKDLICVTCPRGCWLKVLTDGEKILEIRGNSCRRGCGYAETELRDPRRMIASTVRVKNGIHPVLPVALSAPIPKPLISDLLRVISQITAAAPVKMGDVLIRDVLGSGVDVIASRDLPAQK